MKFFKQIKIYFLVGVLAVGCAHKTEKEIERKIALQPPVSNIQEFLDESDKIINEAENISDAQRAQLIVLRREVLSQADQKDKEEMRLRLVLLKETLKIEYNVYEVNLIQQKISKLNKEKHTILTKSLNEAVRIIGKPYDHKDYFDFDHTVLEHEIR